MANSNFYRPGSRHHRVLKCIRMLMAALVLSVIMLSACSSARVVFTTGFGENEVFRAVPDGCTTFDATGLQIYPGFVDAHCHVGLDGTEIGRAHV